MIFTVAVLSGVGLACGVAIYFMGKVLPKESESLERTGHIVELLPGINCGACGQPGCFAYAQEVAGDTDYITDKPCMTLLHDDEGLSKMEDYLGIELDTSSMAKMAVIHCYGKSEKQYDYEGVDTCKGASRVAGGYKQCPFGCLGLGDCAAVCPTDAISIDPEENVAVVDPDKCIGCGLCVKECPRDIIELVPPEMPQYLGCNYSPLRSIPRRERCDSACIHCRKCVRACETDAVTWNKERNFPEFDLENPAYLPDSIEACPSDIIIPVKRNIKRNEE